MNFKKILFFCTLIPSLIPSIGYGMDTTFQTPSIAFVQPRFTRKNLSTFEFYGSSNTATCSYNARGNKVPLFNYNGPQTLFARFVDPTVDSTDTTNFGPALISGRFHGAKYNFRLIQNIGSNFFISGSTTLLNNKINQISITPVNQYGKALTNTEIEQQAGFTDYLSMLHDNLNQQGNEQFVGPTYVTLGYTNSFQNFTHLDFLDLTFQTGIYASGMNFTKNCKPLFAMQEQNLFCCGIPFQTSMAIGLYDWLNIGGSALIIPFLRTDQQLPMYVNLINNRVLVHSQAMSNIKKDPFLYFNAYMEAEHFVPCTSIMLGFSYIKQGATTVCGKDLTIYPLTTNQSSGTIAPWEIFNLTTALEVDLTKNSKRAMPRVRFTYVCPLWGRSVPKTSALAGQFGIEIRFDF